MSKRGNSVELPIADVVAVGISRLGRASESKSVSATARTANRKTVGGGKR